MELIWGVWFFFGFTVGMIVMNSVNKELDKKENNDDCGDAKDD